MSGVERRAGESGSGEYQSLRDLAGRGAQPVYADVTDAVRASERRLERIIDTIPERACQPAPDGSAEFFNHDTTEQEPTGE